MTRKSEMLVAELVEDLAPVRPLWFRRGMILALTTAAVSTALVIALLGLRHEFQVGAFDPLHLMAVGLFFGLGVAASVTVIVMSRPGVGSDHSGWVWAATMASLLPVVAGVTALGRGTMFAHDTVHGAMFCLVAGAIASVLVLAVLVWWLRQGAPTAPDRAGLVAGIAAGSFGAFAFSLHCANDDIVHIGIWHSAVVLAMGLVGRAVVPALVRW